MKVLNKILAVIVFHFFMMLGLAVINWSGIFTLINNNTSMFEYVYSWIVAIFVVFFVKGKEI